VLGDGFVPKAFPLPDAQNNALGGYL